MKRLLAFVGGLLLLCGSSAVRGENGAGPKFHLWLYWQMNLGSDQGLEKTTAMVQRLKKAGYTGIAYLDNQMMRTTQWDAKFDANLAKLRQVCTEQQMELCATVLPLGYANDLMWADPNLAEAIPVVDAPFVVKGGKIVSSDPIKLVNPEFAEGKANVPKGWSVDKPGVALFVDKDVTYQGKASLRLEDVGKNGEFNHARAWQQLKVKPFQTYHLSVAIKTEDYQGRDTRIMALGSRDGKEHTGRVLHTAALSGIKPTQDFTVFHKTFNTVDCDQIVVYVGDWGGGTGKIWFADPVIEPAGLSNLVRRDGAPFKAMSLDGKIVYAEGKDLPVVKDPELGMSGHHGGYQWHVGPEPVVPAGSRLKEGDKLLLSYATTHVMEYNDQVPICMSEPKTYELIDKVIAHAQEKLKPDYWFFEHDEIRMQGWDKSCTDTGKTCGGILADNISRCWAILQKHAPGAKAYVWSDMFDPFHNADYKGDFYVMNKGMAPYDKSWEGLPKEMGLINWNAGKQESVEFFSKQGHPQILSAPNGSTIKGYLEKSGELSGVDGAIYVTWSGDFGPNVEKFAEAVRGWRKAKAGR